MVKVEIENERKYVLNRNWAMRDFFGENPRLIHQGYLKKSVRVRQFSKWDGVSWTPSEAYLNTKSRDASDNVLESSEEIGFHTFGVLYSLVSRKLVKQRISIEDGVCKWDIDFFLREDNALSFVMAECEMPEGMERPDRIHPEIEKNLLYIVPKKENLFSSYKLCDSKHMKKMWEYASRSGRKAA